MFSGGIVISGGGTAKYNKIAMNVPTYIHTAVGNLDQMKSSCIAY